MEHEAATVSGGGKGARIAAALAWTGLGLALACGLVEVLAGLGYRWGWWHFRVGIQIMRWSATTDLAAVALALAAAILAYRLGARRALATGAAGLVLALLVAGPPLYQWRMLDQVPRIHDISTDTEAPPAYVAVLPLRKGAENSADYSAEVAPLQKKAYPDIAPVMLDLPPAQAFARAERAARAMGWDIVAAVPEALRIEATDTTLLFGFKDDIVIRVSVAGSGSRVDVRSLSRVGRSDFGVNANRIRKYMKQLAAG
ncbi:MAG: DUF1499 domain-containing protein [Proteobacteria bacterium]|nr:DUF1499 domain-containing protein [Pseudomonadota bacterium]